MIEIVSAYRRSGNEWCTCCLSNKDTKRIQISQDRTQGISFILCPDCRKRMIDILIEADKKV